MYNIYIFYYHHSFITAYECLWPTIHMCPELVTTQELYGFIISKSPYVIISTVARPGRGYPEKS